VTPIPDIVALAATPNSDGIVRLPGTVATGVFAVATVNIGAGGPITVSADTGVANLPVALSICETNPATGTCLAAPAGTVTTQINGNATPTFGVFVAGSDVVPFDPARHRIFVQFEDAAGITRGSTSVAVQTSTSAPPPTENQPPAFPQPTRTSVTTQNHYFHVDAGYPIRSTSAWNRPSNCD
jgi:hypothetical protein